MATLGGSIPTICIHDYEYHDVIKTICPASQLRTCRKCKNEAWVSICSFGKPCDDCFKDGCKCLCHAFKKGPLNFRISDQIQQSESE